MAEDATYKAAEGREAAAQDSVKITPPVEPSEIEATEEAPRTGTALCLSGGGYRAMLFHLGTLWRLNEFGYLPKLDRVSSVSGGSITAGVLGVNWTHLDFDDRGVARQFKTFLVDPVRRLGEKTIDIPSVLRGAFGFGSIGNKVAKAYRKGLFGSATLQSLPDRPRFVFNATNMQSGVLWRFSKPYTWDYRVGKIENPGIELAVAVAASAAFPPILSPVVIELNDSAFVPNTGKDLQRPPFTTRVVLTDGGVYDNLGLETAWKSCRTILISDAGGSLPPEEKPKRDWLRHLMRNLFIIDNQVRSLRKRNIMDAYEAKTHLGAFWSIRTNILDYRLPHVPLNCPFQKTIQLANVTTRLKRLSTVTQERLINWGYAVCDAAMRKHVDGSLSEPTSFPYPSAGVG